MFTKTESLTDKTHDEFTCTGDMKSVPRPHSTDRYHTSRGPGPQAVINLNSSVSHHTLLVSGTTARVSTYTLLLCYRGMIFIYTLPLLWSVFQIFCARQLNPADVAVYEHISNIYNSTQYCIQDHPSLFTRSKGEPHNTFIYTHNVHDNLQFWKSRSTFWKNKENYNYIA
jgi:hypothetical protein